ncbi:MAG: outer membrane protein assembly factor BamD [bacterium]
MRYLLLLSAALFAICPWSHAQVPETNEPAPASAPKRQQVNSDTTPEEQADFDAAAGLDKEGSVASAVAAYRRFIKKHPASPLAMKAQFRTAELFEELGESTKAFNAYQNLVTQYPDTPEFERAVNRQVAIANDYLAGKKVKLLGVSFLSGTDRAEEMFASIIQNAPYSKNAPIAQFNLGLTYERQNRVQEAAKAYQGVLDRYPNSSIADDAMYQIGYIYMRLGQSGKTNDLSALLTAKHTFEDFLIQYPNSEKAAQAKDNVALLSTKESGDLISIAKFYDRSKNHRAAAIYYNDVIRRAPTSKEASTARDRVQEIRSEAGDDALRTGPEQTQTGETAALRRRLQAQVETSALANFNGPPKKDIVPDELPVSTPPKLRTDSRDVAPMPAVESALPTP